LKKHENLFKEFLKQEEPGNLLLLKSFPIISKYENPQNDLSPCLKDETFALLQTKVRGHLEPVFIKMTQLVRF